MLQPIDLLKKVSREDYKIQMDELQNKLSFLQRKISELKIPVIILFEGWGASGKGTLINKLLSPLDPRGVNVYSSSKLSEDELMRPFLWSFWTKTPPKGRITILDRSWYRKVLSERIDKKIEAQDIKEIYKDINAFETQLTDDNNIIIKIFLHISKEEQVNRFKKLEDNEATAWRVTKDDWKHNEEYDKYVKVINDMLQNTDNPVSPWNVVQSEDKRYASIEILKIVINTIEEKINKVNEESDDIIIKPLNNNINLSSLNLSKDITKEEYNVKLKHYQKRIRELGYEMYVNRIPVVIVFEGWDAAGKGGSIKRLTEKMDPRGYEVVPIASPTEIEKSHHYLWRFWNKIPKNGHMTIFDRSWYGRVMVERIEGFCLEKEWKRAYSEINDMEKQLANNGTVVIKFWLHIDKDEQLNRFNARLNDPQKQWKITDEDWRNRDKWTQYEQAVEDMINNTGTDYAPWIPVEANSKNYARIKILKTVVETIEKKLKK